jgi:hypothetical protein
MSSLKDRAPENFAQLLSKTPPPIQIYGRDKLPRGIMSHSQTDFFNQQSTLPKALHHCFQR